LPIVYDSAIAAVRQLLQHGAPDCLRFFACVGSYHHALIACNSANGGGWGVIMTHLPIAYDPASWSGGGEKFGVLFFRGC